MRKLFEMERVFVWYPKHNLTPSLRCELSGIYRKIGARDIYESLFREESFLVNDGP
jgi:hypothetical protein